MDSSCSVVVLRGLVYESATMQIFGFKQALHKALFLTAIVVPDDASKWWGICGHSQRMNTHVNT